MSDEWQAVFDALEQVKLELEDKWPVPYCRPRAHLLGYTRERGRRCIILEAE